jgi:membrane protease YdiL (CAAX protease family)
MRHLKFSFSGKNAIWRYLVLLGAVFIAANTVGGIPLIIGFATRSVTDPQALARLSANPSDLSVIGIAPNLAFFMMLFPFLAALIAFAILVKPLHGRTLRQTIGGAASIRWKRALVSALVWTIFSAIYLFGYQFLVPANFRINNTSSTLFWLVIISFLFIPFQASFEEIIFRGYLMQGFTALPRKGRGFFRYISFVAGSTLFPIFMTSLLFGIMHAWNPEIKEYGFFTMIPQYMLFGLLFGIITVLDDGIEIAAGAHASNNIFLSIMLTNSSSALQTPAVFEQINIQPWVDFWSLLVISVIFFIIMKKIYGWKDFSVLWRKVLPPPDIDHIL